MSNHVVPIRTYVLVFLTLLACTALTAGVAFVDLGAMNTVVALVIAVFKMLLVILFFMHVRYSSQLTKIVVSAAFLWLAILIVISSSDYLTRSWIPDPQNWGPSTAVISTEPSSLPELSAPPPSAAQQPANAADAR